MTSLVDEGERFIPEASSPRMREDHLARYRFASTFTRGKDVLDIACGTGYGTYFLREQGARSVIGMDVSDDALSYAQEHFGQSGISFQSGDVQGLPFREACDVIVSFETIEHVQDYRRTLRSLHEALRPGGVLLLSTPNRPLSSPAARTLSNAPLNRFHVREFTLSEMQRALIEAGFPSVDIQSYGQRFQWPLRSRFLRALYQRLCRPNVRASAVVQPVRRWLQPRYMVFVAKKSG